MRPGTDGEFVMHFRGSICGDVRKDTTGKGDPVVNFCVEHTWTNSRGEQTIEKIAVVAYGPCATVMKGAEHGRRVVGRGMWRRGQLIADVVEVF